ncbi:BRCT domain-containing protein [Durusdinium trenchii]|uniref:BRCT domain-containing protein n=1 Tax=Durusdinium trenchii TaxID=1381693 RepID=A0ABP0Q443_9DINO
MSLTAWYLVWLLVMDLICFSQAVQPLPGNQDEFFDLLPSQFPFPLPKFSLDPIAGRLRLACNSVQDLLALSIASSQLHSFNVKEDGSYDLSLPPFELSMEEERLLLDTCEHMSLLYAQLASYSLLHQLSCIAGSCTTHTTLDTASHEALAGHSLKSLCLDMPLDEAAEAFETGLGLSEVRFRALARMGRVTSHFCRVWSPMLADQSTPEKPHLWIDQAADEVRNFLDHAFQSLSVTRVLSNMPPLSEFLGHTSPVFYHVPIAGQRWNVLLYLLSSFPRSERDRGLRVAEIGVEKGMTITYLMKHDPAIQEYTAVDPWHIAGKSAQSNAVLEGYYQNIKWWAHKEQAFQRDGQSAVNLIRKTSEEAAGFVGLDYFDLVFIDGDHTFEAAQRDIQVWKRRVRPGGIIAGHDFSLFHAAVSLAVLLECGPHGNDYTRFPLEAEGGKPIIRLSSDSVWWVVRA